MGVEKALPELLLGAVGVRLLICTFNSCGTSFESCSNLQLTTTNEAKSNLTTELSIETSLMTISSVVKYDVG